jgi:hypothetical protein
MVWHWHARRPYSFILGGWILVNLIQRIFRKKKDKQIIALLRETVDIHKEHVKVLKEVHKLDIKALLWALERAERGKRNESLPGIF